MNGRNATISAYYQRTGTRGDGMPVFAENALTLTAPMPCTLADPSAYRVATEQTAGRDVRVLIQISARGVRAAGIEPKPGDRVRFAPLRTGAPVVELDIVGVRDLPGSASQTFEFSLGKHADGQTPGGS